MSGRLHAEPLSPMGLRFGGVGQGRPGPSHLREAQEIKGPDKASEMGQETGGSRTQNLCSASPLGHLCLLPATCTKILRAHRERLLEDLREEGWGLSHPLRSLSHGGCRVWRLGAWGPGNLLFSGLSTAPGLSIPHSLPASGEPLLS